MCVASAGLLSIVTNFKQTKDAVSGPLAIVAAGADVARSDAASLLQFAAIVNVNLAIVNALPLPVSTKGHELPNLIVKSSNCQAAAVCLISPFVKAPPL